MAHMAPTAYITIPPPSLPEFYLPRRDADDVDSSCSSTSSASDETTDHANCRTSATRHTVTFQTPLTGDGIYDGIPPNLTNGLPGFRAPMTSAVPPIILNEQTQNSPVGYIPPLAIFHVCRICLHPRSPKYHRQHPIPVNGVPPPPSICRRCRIISVEEKPLSTTRKQIVELRERQESDDVKLGIKCLVPDDDIVTDDDMRGRDVKVLIDRRATRTTSSPPTRTITYRYIRPSQSFAKRPPSGSSSSSSASSSSPSRSKLPQNLEGPNRPDVHAIVRKEIERINFSDHRQCHTSSQIRELARDEIERYRGAERRLASYTRPYAHGRMVSVEDFDQLERNAEIREPTQKYPSPPVQTQSRDTEIREPSKASRPSARVLSPYVEIRKPDEEQTFKIVVEKDKRVKDRGPKAPQAFIRKPSMTTKSKSITGNRRNQIESASVVNGSVRRDSTQSPPVGDLSRQATDSHNQKSADRGGTSLDNDNEDQGSNHSSKRDSNNEEAGIIEVVPPDDPNDATFNDLLFVSSPFRELPRHETNSTSQQQPQLNDNRSERKSRVSDGESSGKRRPTAVNGDSSNIQRRSTRGARTPRYVEEEIEETFEWVPDSTGYRDNIERSNQGNQSKSERQLPREDRNTHPSTEYKILERWITPTELTRHRQNIFDEQNRNQERISRQRSDSTTRSSRKDSGSDKDQRERYRVRYVESRPETIREPNHVQFSNTVTVSPTPPDSDASSSAFRSFRVSEHGTTRPLKTRGRFLQARARKTDREQSGRSRNDEDTHKRKANVSSEIDHPRGRRRADRFNRALSESPSREESVVSGGNSYLHGPYRRRGRSDSLEARDGTR